MSMLYSRWVKASGVASTRRVHSSLVCVVLLCVLIAALFSLPVVASASEACQNEARRAEQDSMSTMMSLPDCRAYEMVTPPDKDSGEPRAVVGGLAEPNLQGIEGAQASMIGDRMAWVSEYPLPGSVSPGLDYLSTRGERGWSSENVIPPQSVQNGTNCPTIVGMAAYSSDLSKGILADGFGQPESFKGEGLNCGHDEPRLVPGEPQGFQNLFLRNNDVHSYALVNVTPPDAPAPKPAPGDPQYFPAGFLAGSSDLSHVLFEEELELTPGAPSGDDLYEWTNGTVHLVTILPDGTPVLGTLAGTTKNTELVEATGEYVPFNIANFRHAVSGDGSRVFFEAGSHLYVRENPEQSQSPFGPHGECIVPADACTLQVDASQAFGPGGGGKFMVASENGSKVFFTDIDSAGLTSDTVPGSGQNLYEYDLQSGELTDLTPSVGEANVEGVSGASEDGSYLYFVAEGKLASNTTAGHAAIIDQPNLYVFHAGVLKFIATLDASAAKQYGDSCDWMSRECTSYPLFGGLTARVSANGAFIGFDSDKSLTGYENTGPSCVPVLISGSAGVAGFEAGSCEEIFLYDAAAGRLSCASCDPSGVAPTGPAMIRFPATNTSAEMRNAYPQRNVSDDGRVFFETPEALVPGDTDGTRDVYEYENGRPFLVSSGISEANSYFLDASVNGNDVFFATTQQLIPHDSDAVYDIYDARVDGGFLEPILSSSSCEGDGCIMAAAAPIFTTPASTTFNGIGDVPPQAPTTSPVVKPKSKAKLAKCKKGYVKKKGKCVKKSTTKAKKIAKRRK